MCELQVSKETIEAIAVMTYSARETPSMEKNQRVRFRDFRWCQLLDVCLVRENVLLCLFVENIVTAHVEDLAAVVCLDRCAFRTERLQSSTFREICDGSSRGILDHQRLRCCRGGSNVSGAEQSNGEKHDGRLCTSYLENSRESFLSLAFLYSHSIRETWISS